MTVPTVHRRSVDWTMAALWQRPHQTVLDEIGSRAWSLGTAFHAESEEKRFGPEAVDESMNVVA
ncbi:hypothetical protein F4560_003284 [Saccharothrix ecbatanensis]|uniref:Uncharacterized protein n=1 Tax=Saccharothrix ecbatanensis TaxID=1105145 RepID=A0A7W9M144_9PSEU|nr:hypothetical protein [Saccharothrix ecbatanensis]